MKTKNILIGLLLILVTNFLFSCSKDDETQPVGLSPQQNNPQNPNSPVVIHGTDYIEFKLDGNPVSYNNFLVTPPALSIGTANYSNMPSIPLYKLHGLFMSISGTPVSFVKLDISDSIPITTGQYSFTNFSSVWRKAAFSIGYSNGTFLFPEQTSVGYIEITRLDSVDEGKCEGTFSFSNLSLIDDDENILSGNHTLTEGKFSLTVNL